jgi:hypothetical protein
MVKGSDNGGYELFQFATKVTNNASTEWTQIWHQSRHWDKRVYPKRFQTGRLERELQMVQLSATGCSCIAILWASLVSFAAITLCVASQRILIVVSVYFVIDSVPKLLNTPSFFNFLQRLLTTQVKNGNKCNTKACTGIQNTGAKRSWTHKERSHRPTASRRFKDR